MFEDDEMTSGQPASSACTFLSEKAVARRLGLSAKWLQKMRYQGGGIPFHKFGGAIRYAVADIEQFEAATRCSSTSSPLAMYTSKDRKNGEGRDSITSTSGQEGEGR